jgi:hypothetical protein
MSDPLEDLVVDESEMARDELAKLLRPYVRFARDGTMLFEDSFQGLPARARVLCALLALRAMNILGLRPDPGAGPQVLVDLTNMPPGTVRPKLRELAKSRLVTKEAGNYVVPNAAMRRAAAAIGEEGDG